MCIPRFEELDTSALKDMFIANLERDDDFLTFSIRIVNPNAEVTEIERTAMVAVLTNITNERLGINIPNVIFNHFPDLPQRFAGNPLGLYRQIIEIRSDVAEEPSTPMAPTSTPSNTPPRDEWEDVLSDESWQRFSDENSSDSASDSSQLTSDDEDEAADVPIVDLSCEEVLTPLTDTDDTDVVPVQEEAIVNVPSIEELDVPTREEFNNIVQQVDSEIQDILDDIAAANLRPISPISSQKQGEIDGDDEERLLETIITDLLEEMVVDLTDEEDEVSNGSSSYESVIYDDESDESVTSDDESVTSDDESDEYVISDNEYGEYVISDDEEDEEDHSDTWNAQIGEYVSSINQKIANCLDSTIESDYYTCSEDTCSYIDLTDESEQSMQESSEESDCGSEKEKTFRMTYEAALYLKKKNRKSKKSKRLQRQQN